MIESIGLTENGNLCGEVTINNIQCHYFVRRGFYHFSYEGLLLEDGEEEYTLTIGFGPLWFEPAMANLGEWPSLSKISKALSKKRLKIDDDFIYDEARNQWIHLSYIREWYL